MSWQQEMCAWNPAEAIEGAFGWGIVGGIVIAWVGYRLGVAIDRWTYRAAKASLERMEDRLKKAVGE